ncbi:MAG: 5'-methylthioadenosine nucleosidase [Planctomycetaceae bacterium]|nr:5'-methylthioadenosine nucleosidase [Planctomycetaceae bacterium]
MTDTENGDLAHADIGLVAAMSMEMAPFLARCERVRKYVGRDLTFRGGRYDGVRVVVVESGAGRVRAEKATHALLDAHSPHWVISSGFAGGLSDAARAGHIVVADSVVNASGEQLSLDTHMTSDPARGLHVGRVYTTDAIVRTVSEKRSLAANSGAIAVDMESFAVARVCRERQVRCLVIRALTDDVTADLPQEALTLFGETGTVRFGAVVGSLLKRPGSASDLWKLREQGQRAAAALATFLDGVVIQLGRATPKS